MHLSIRLPLGNKALRVAPATVPLTMSVKQKQDSIQHTEHDSPKASLCSFHLALFKRKVALWETADQCYYCLPWRYHATWTPSWILENTESDFCFLFSLWHLIRAALLPQYLFISWEPGLEMTMDASETTKPFWRRRKEVSHVAMGGPWMKPSAWSNSRTTGLSPRRWPSSPVSQLGKSLTTSNHRFPFGVPSRRQPHRVYSQGCDGGTNATMMWKRGLCRWKLLSNRVSKLACL